MRVLRLLLRDPVVTTAGVSRRCILLPMKRWIETWKVEPPHQQTISGRFGEA
jgi:hypothetical protein